MTYRPTALERAFELARAGEDFQAIRKKLRAEHLSESQIDGPSVKRQLRELRLAALAQPGAG